MRCAEYDQNSDSCTYGFLSHDLAPVENGHATLRVANEVIERHLSALPLAPLLSFGEV
jgi:hypothetical protein